MRYANATTYRLWSRPVHADETFRDPNRGLSREERLERMLEDFDETAPLPPSVSGWPRVRIAIRRGEMFIIETATASFTAMLRFCPEKPEIGNFEIHHLPRGGVERGRTLRLKELPADETDSRVSMLAPFRVRYFIVTGADDRARTQLVWLVGLRDFRSVDVAEENESAT